MGTKVGNSKKKNKDPEFDYDEQYKELERVRIQEQMAEEDGDPEKLHLWGRLRTEGVCLCSACDKRRLWNATRQAGKKEEQLEKQKDLDAVIWACFRATPEDFAYLDEMVSKYGPQSVCLYEGGPIAVSNCEVCAAGPSKDTCYHCGKMPWMRHRVDLKFARRDCGQMTRYMETRPLQAAAIGSKFEMVEKLIGLGAHVNVRDMMGCTALHWAACSGHLKKPDQQQAVLIAELLLRDGVDVTFEDFNGKTAIELTSKPNPVFNAMRMAILRSARKMLGENLLEACKEGTSEVVMRILKSGADLGVGDWLNDTPMHVLAMYGHLDLALELVEVADKEARLLQLLEAKTVDGLTPEDTALKWGYKMMAAKLKSVAQNARVLEVVEKLAKGNKVPRELAGTKLGMQLEQEMRSYNKPMNRLLRTLGMEEKKKDVIDKTAKMQSLQKARASKGEGKSAVCAVS